MKSTVSLPTGAAIAATVALITALSILPAHATFVATTIETKDDVTMFNIGANHGVSIFNGSLRKNNTEQDIGITTDGSVDTGNGNANITPDGGPLTFLSFDPNPKFVSLDGFFANVQLECSASNTNCNKNKGSFTINVNGGGVGQTFTFTQKVDGNDHNNGFDEPYIFNGKKVTGDQESLESLITGVTMTAGLGYDFKDVKQIDWSECSLGGGCGVSINPTSVPEPSTWAMFVAGFGIMGLLGWRPGSGRLSPSAR
jgi:hypothetical protein